MELDNLVSPVSFELVPEKERVIMTVDTDKGVQTVILTYPQAMSLVSEGNLLKKRLVNGHTDTPNVDFFHPHHAKGNGGERSVQMSAKEYQKFKYLMIENKNLQKKIRLLKKQINGNKPKHQTFLHKLFF